MEFFFESLGGALFLTLNPLTWGASLWFSCREKYSLPLTIRRTVLVSILSVIVLIYFINVNEPSRNVACYQMILSAIISGSVVGVFSYFISIGYLNKTGGGNWKIADDAFLEKIYNELDSGKVDKPTWIKSLMQSDGNTLRQKEIYIKTRINEISNKSTSSPIRYDEYYGIKELFLHLLLSFISVLLVAYVINPSPEKEIGFNTGLVLGSLRYERPPLMNDGILLLIIIWPYYARLVYCFLNKYK